MDSPENFMSHLGNFSRTLTENFNSNSMVNLRCPFTLIMHVNKYRHQKKICIWTNCRQVEIISISD